MHFPTVLILIFISTVYSYPGLIHSPTDNISRPKRSVLIWPGTKWCGSGNKADSYADLGNKDDIDSCCKQHDQCPYVIEGLKQRYHLFNYRWYTLSHCECDEKFRECLQAANDADAKSIGRMYFNYANTECFDLELHKVCRRKSFWGLCKEHQLQWVAKPKLQQKF